MSTVLHGQTKTGALLRALPAGSRKPPKVLVSEPGQEPARLTSNMGVLTAGPAVRGSADALVCEELKPDRLIRASARRPAVSLQECGSRRSPKRCSPRAPVLARRGRRCVPRNDKFCNECTRDLSIAIERIVQVAWPRPLFNLSAAVESSVRSAIDPHQSFVLL